MDWLTEIEQRLKVADAELIVNGPTYIAKLIAAVEAAEVAMEDALSTLGPYDEDAAQELCDAICKLQSGKFGEGEQG